MREAKAATERTLACNAFSMHESSGEVRLVGEIKTKRVRGTLIHSSNFDKTRTVVDLFCGAGGLSTALEAVGWTTVAAIDNDPDCIATLRENQERQIAIAGLPGRHYLQDAMLIEGDIRHVSGSDLRPGGASSWRPDLLVGGPPCQPFSSAGRMRGLHDPRGQLFSDFVRLARELRPRLILFENVAGLVTAKSESGRSGGVLAMIQESFEELGYACRFALLNAADYGSPQRRVRLFMIGARSEPLPEFPAQTHSRENQVTFEPRVPWVTLRQFLATQPPPLEGDIVRPHESMREALSRLLPGTGLRASGIVEANRPGGHWGYRQDGFLSDPEAPARTIRAATTPDWIHGPGDSLRRLTWRECAGLQGFPPEWSFVGSVASRFRQIGNAVQGNIGRAIGRVLYRVSMSGRRRRPRSAAWPPDFIRRIRYTEMEETVNGHHRGLAKRLRAAEG